MEDNNTEDLRNIPGYDKNYFVDKLGNIYSKKSGKLKKLAVNDDHRGYLICGLKRNNGSSYPIKVHHAVLYAFVGPRPGTNYVGMHKDDNPYNNSLENLKWGTITENQEQKLKSQAKAIPDKRKIDIEKRNIAKRMVTLGFTQQEISLLTGWPIKKVEKELAKESA